MVGFGVRLFVALNRFFGVAPFDMSLAVMAPKVASQTTSITLKMHQMMPTYSALCLYVMCLASIFWQQKNGSDISVAANWLQFIPNAFSYVVCLYAGARQRELSVKILTTFYECDQKLKDSLGVNFRKYNKKSNYLSYLASVVTVIIGLLLGSLTYMKTVSWGNIWSFLYWLAFCLPKFSLMLINLQFASCVYYIISREQLIKKTLNHCYLREDQQPMVISSWIGNGNNADDAAQRKNKVSPVTGKRTHHSKETQLKCCATLRDVISMLQGLVDMINSYFGKQIVMNLLSAFVCVTVQLHYTIRQIRYAFNTTDSEIMVTISSTLIGMHILEILVIFGCGDRAKSKWTELITEVQRIRQQITDEEVRTQLFDVINTMCYKRIEFHGCNLFTIDLSVITGLISSVATYLIVLVQFQINEEQSGRMSEVGDTKVFTVEDPGID